MKNARRVIAIFYILISVFSLLSLGGCRSFDHRGGDFNHDEGRGDRH
jgi:hypothetical protein